MILFCTGLILTLPNPNKLLTGDTVKLRSSILLKSKNSQL